MKNSCCAVFIKAPVEGFVKTRLARDVGDQRAVLMYKHMAEKVIREATKAELSVKIAFTPVAYEKVVSKWFPGQELIPQVGDDLGTRMAQVAERLFEDGCNKVVIIGSDVPEIRERHIIEAVALLEENDVVLGPTFDGGYYLIGLDRDSYTKTIFENVTWGTSSVLQETEVNAENKRLRVKLIEFLQDIDTIDDWYECLRRNKV